MLLQTKVRQDLGVGGLQPLRPFLRDLRLNRMGLTAAGAGRAPLLWRRDEICARSQVAPRACRG